MYRYMSTASVAQIKIILIIMKKKHHQELFQLLSKMKSTKDAEKLLKDLLTPQELDSIAERWQIVKMLEKRIPHREISEKLGVSISKVTRGSRAFQYGSQGFKTFLKR